MKKKSLFGVFIVLGCIGVAAYALNPASVMASPDAETVLKNATWPKFTTWPRSDGYKLAYELTNGVLSIDIAPIAGGPEVPFASLVIVKGDEMTRHPFDGANQISLDLPIEDVASFSGNTFVISVFIEDAKERLIQTALQHHWSL